MHIKSLTVKVLIATVGILMFASTPAAAATVRVPVLMYHYIDKPPANAQVDVLDLVVARTSFQVQMKYLRDAGYHTMKPDMLIGALTTGTSLPTKPIMLTFDDGLEDAYTNVFPILKQNGFTGTFFIVTGFIDAHRSGYLTWDQVKEMSAAGMSIEDHSKTHQDMSGRTLDWLKAEVVDTRDEITTYTGIRPLVFCYPSGRYDVNTLKALRSSGFVMAFTTRGSTYLNSTQMLTLPRVRIHGSTTLQEFVSLVNLNQ